MDDAAALDTFYSDPDPWGYHSNSEDAKRRDVMLAAIPKRKYAATLDIGCGNGFITAHLPGEKVIGVDISQKAVEYARRTATERTTYLAADLFQLRADTLGTFDLIIVTGVFYPQYIAKAQVLAQLIVDQLLQSDGVLVTVHIDAWYRTRFPYLLGSQLTYPYREFTHLLEIYFK